ncbi:MAG: DUF4402 domain-containing protein [Ottowia sp.]|nr:DUF4402 domain-containing protein [Ottowia sp.]
MVAGGSPATKNGSPSISNPGSAANFTLAGNASATFAVTLPSSITLTGPEGATMSVTPLANTILTPMGTTTLSIGGILNVAGAQTKGKYTGKFVLTLDQN